MRRFHTALFLSQLLSDPAWSLAETFDGKLMEKARKKPKRMGKRMNVPSLMDGPLRDSVSSRNVENISPCLVNVTFRQFCLHQHENFRSVVARIPPDQTSKMKRDSRKSSRRKIATSWRPETSLKFRSGRRAKKETPGDITGDKRGRSVYLLKIFDPRHDDVVSVVLCCATVACQKAGACPEFGSSAPSMASSEQ